MSSSSSTWNGLYSNWNTRLVFGDETEKWGVMSRESSRESRRESSRDIFNWLALWVVCFSGQVFALSCEGDEGEVIFVLHRLIFWAATPLKEKEKEEEKEEEREIVSLLVIQNEFKESSLVEILQVSILSCCCTRDSRKSEINRRDCSSEPSERNVVSIDGVRDAAADVVVKKCPTLTRESLVEWMCEQNKRLSSQDSRERESDELSLSFCWWSRFSGIIILSNSLVNWSEQQRLTFFVVDVVTQLNRGFKWRFKWSCGWRLLGNTIIISDQFLSQFLRLMLRRRNLKQIERENTRMCFLFSRSLLVSLLRKTSILLVLLDCSP